MSLQQTFDDSSNVPLRFSLSLVIFQGGLCWDHHMQTEIYRDHTCCAALYFSASASLWFYCTLWMPRHSFWCHIPDGLCWDHYMQMQVSIRMCFLLDTHQFTKICTHRISNVLLKKKLGTTFIDKHRFWCRNLHKLNQSIKLFLLHDCWSNFSERSPSQINFIRSQISRIQNPHKSVGTNLL